MMTLFKKPKHKPTLRRPALSRLMMAMLGLSALTAHAEVNPLQINQLIGLAVQTHPLVGAAVADQKATAEGVTAAKLGYLPTPSVSSQYTNADGTVTSFALNQPLWTGGKLTADVNRAINDDKAATAKILEQQNEVAKNTIDIWQAYIYALSLQELYANNLKQLADFEAMMKRRVAQGVSAKIELDLVTNRILQDQNSLQGAIEQQRIAEARLQQIIGTALGAPSGANVAQMAAQAKADSQNYGDLAFAAVSEKHPTVVRQRYEIDSARYDVKAQQASRYPSVFLQYKNDYIHNDGKFSDDVMVGLSYNPGAGFSNLALARASEARVQSLIQSQEASRRTVMENIQTQYQQFISARDQELSLMAAVAGAQIVLNSYQRQFIAGRKSWLEVLNAVREQSQYEQQLRQVQAQMVASFYKLQVDFALMQWQQQPLEHISQPSEPFRLWDYAKTEVGGYVAAHANTAEPMPVMSTGIDTTGALVASDGTMLRDEPVAEMIELPSVSVQIPTTEEVDTTQADSVDALSIEQGEWEFAEPVSAPAPSEPVAATMGGLTDLSQMQIIEPVIPEAVLDENDSSALADTAGNEMIETVEVVEAVEAVLDAELVDALDAPTTEQ